MAAEAAGVKAAASGLRKAAVATARHGQRQEWSAAAARGKLSAAPAGQLDILTCGYLDGKMVDPHSSDVYIRCTL